MSKQVVLCCGLTAEVWRSRKGYMVGEIPSIGELFIGYKWEPEFYKDTEENRKRLMSEWEFNKVFA